MAVFLVLHDVAKPDQTGQQTVDRAFGQPGLLCQPLQTDPRGVRRQLLDQLKDALTLCTPVFSAMIRAS